MRAGFVMWHGISFRAVRISAFIMLSSYYLNYLRMLILSDSKFLPYTYRVDTVLLGKRLSSTRRLYHLSHFYCCCSCSLQRWNCYLATVLNLFNQNPGILVHWWCADISQNTSIRQPGLFWIFESIFLSPPSVLRLSFSFLNPKPYCWNLLYRFIDRHLLNALGIDNSTLFYAKIDGHCINVDIKM